MRKQIAFGFLTGLILTLGFLCTAKGVEAASKVAQTVNYPIYIDNKAWAPSTPALNVEGSTYLPLRAMSEALDVEITWDQSARRVDVYKETKPVSSQQQPAPSQEADSQTQQSAPSQEADSQTQQSAPSQEADSQAQQSTDSQGAQTAE